LNKRIILLLAIIFCLSFLGCNSQVQKEPNQTSPTVSISSTTNSSRPNDPVSIEAIFPNGAPALNQIAEIIVIIKTPGTSLKDFDLKVSLPEGLESVSGELTWHGDVPINSEVTVIKAKTKSIKVGSWTINVTSHSDPKINPKYGGTGNNPIYVLISEKSAEWRLNPAYPNNLPLPSGNVTVAPTNDTSNLPPPPASSASK
jgi:hypothetical protein